MVTTLLLGQGDISPPLWADAPQGLLHNLEVQVGLEATHPVEDLNLRMASLRPAPHDPGRASAHASGHLYELPSL